MSVSLKSQWLKKIELFWNFLKKVVDTFLIHWHNIRCCLEVRHYLSWIEGLTTNQNVIGSNPIRRTNWNWKPPATGAFLLWKHRMDSNLGRGASVKKTRSVFSERARAPAGGRSRCAFAQQMRGCPTAPTIWSFRARVPKGCGLVSFRCRWD